MMERVRAGLAEAIPDRPIKPKHWWGPGAVAQALLDDYLGSDSENDDLDDAAGSPSKRPGALGVIEPESEPFKWSTHAYFGARIELLKQGVTRQPVFEFDISSAYPATIAELPSLKGGRWEYKLTPTREDVESASIVSMFHVRTHGFEWGLPFYPLPFRTNNNAILFKPSVEGYYMRDDVIAAFKWFDEFERRERLWRRGAGLAAPEIELVSAWLFHPADPQERPFAWVQDLFNYRLKLLEENKDDVRAYIIKLALNSLYGKFAQRVGERGNPPKFAVCRCSRRRSQPPHAVN